MPPSIFLVYAGCGTWDQNRRWWVRAFVDRDEAVRFAAAANEFARMHFNNGVPLSSEHENAWSWYDIEDEKSVPWVHPLDPNYEYVGDGVTEYGVFQVPLGAIP